ncbi:MAG: hypothetical protein M3N39_03095, partial [Pseudomonadota bacterium]|nr:hypothetical protein [Pseudomonadota bacterium]
RRRIRAVIDYHKGSQAAGAIAGLSILSVGLGVLLLSQLGGSSGQDLGSDAAATAWARVVPILLAAEVVKLLIAAFQAIVTFALLGSRAGAGRWPLLVVGLLGAFSIAASGVVGLYAIVAHEPELTAQTSALGFLGMVSTGLWALLVVVLRPISLGAWQSALGLMMAAASTAPLFFPPAAMIAGILGVLWWFGIAMRLREISRIVWAVLIHGGSASRDCFASVRLNRLHPCSQSFRMSPFHPLQTFSAAVRSACRF